MWLNWYNYYLECITDNQVIHRNSLVMAGRPVGEDYLFPFNLNNKDISCLEEIFKGHSLRIVSKVKLTKESMEEYFNSCFFEECLERILYLDPKDYNTNTQKFLCKYYFNFYKFYLSLDLLGKESLKNYLDFNLRLGFYD